jgi:arsenate reductase (thioredoxin)
LVSGQATAFINPIKLVNPQGWIEAAIRPHLNTRAMQVLAEIGIDISGRRSRSMNEFLGRRIDTVITVCGKSDAVCPVFPGQVNRYHWAFDDPHHTRGAEEEIMADFRRVRDRIAQVFRAYAAGLKEGGGFAARSRAPQSP